MSDRFENPRTFWSRVISTSKNALEKLTLPETPVDEDRMDILQRQIENGNLKVRKERSPSSGSLTTTGRILRQGLKRTVGSDEEA